MPRAGWYVWQMIVGCRSDDWIYWHFSYPELNLTYKWGQIEMEVYRKPTMMDITINNTSHHPKDHKLAAFKNWIHRLTMLALNENSKKKELNTIINIALNN
jgi:hypothetical protein